MSNVQPTHKSYGGGIVWPLLAIATILLVAIALAFSLGTIDTAGGQRLLCLVGDQVVFDHHVDSAVQVGNTITITLAGHTERITPPEGGECHIAKP